MTTTKRIPELDALRGVAAIAVVLFHYFTNYHKHYTHNFSVPELFALGRTGVDLFFIISGFVIYWTLTRSDNVLQFAWSRFSRLYPVFWVAVIVSFLSITFIGPDDRSVSIKSALINLTMIHEYLHVPHVDRVYWTLTIELAFYALVGIAFMLKLTKYTSAICFIWVLGAVTVHVKGVDLGLIGKLLILKYCHLFVAGVMFYKLWSGDIKVFHALPILLLCLVGAYLENTGIARAVVMGYYVLFPLAIFGKLKFLTNKALVWLGTISYSLYLIHQNIGYGLIKQLYAIHVSPMISIPLCIAISLIMAQLLTTYVEKPSMRKLRYLADKVRHQKGA